MPLAIDSDASVSLVVEFVSRIILGSDGGLSVSVFEEFLNHYLGLLAVQYYYRSLTIGVSKLSCWLCGEYIAIVLSNSDY